MANWYNTEFTITGNQTDLAMIQTIFDRIHPDEYGELQLIDLAEAMDCNIETTFCAGYIDGNSLVYGDNRIDFVTYSKWQAPYQVIYALCKQFESLHYNFLAYLEDTYQTNDAAGRFYPKRVYVVLFFNNFVEERGFKTESEALEWISGEMGRDFKSEDDVKQYFDAEQNSYCVFHHVQVIDENEQISFWSEKPGVVSLWNLDGTRVGEITYTIGNN